MHDVAVVGGGIVGISAATHLARSGLETLLIDQHEPLDNRRASHGSSRAYRYDTNKDKHKENLVTRALQLYRQAQDETGIPIIENTGELLLGEEEDSYAERSLASLHHFGHDADLLTADELDDRYPQFKHARVTVHDHDGGMLRPTNAIRAYSRLAQEAGVTLTHGSHVTDVDQGSVGTLDGAVYDTENIVLATGAWTSQLIDLPIHAEKQHIVYFEAGELFELGRFPVFGHMDQDTRFYGFPAHQGHGVKVARHETGATVHPSQYDNHVPPGFRANCRQFLHEYIPDLAQNMVEKTDTCHYAVTSDQEFVIDEYEPGMYVAAGFNGEGFKFGPAIGERVADMVTGNQPRTERFSADRF